MQISPTRSSLSAGRSLAVALLPQRGPSRFVGLTAAFWLASAALHSVVFVFSNTAWSGAISWRKPILFSLSIGLVLWAFGSIPGAAIFSLMGTMVGIMALMLVGFGVWSLVERPSNRLERTAVFAGMATFDDDPRLRTLTEREHEVLVPMAHGLSNDEIATALFIAENTVKTHVKRVMSKLGARDRVQAVVAAYEGGLMDNP